MFITVIDGRVIPIAKRYFSSVSLRAMSGDLAGLIGARIGFIFFVYAKSLSRNERDCFLMAFQNEQLDKEEDSKDYHKGMNVFPLSFRSLD